MRAKTVSFPSVCFLHVYRITELRYYTVGTIQKLYLVRALLQKHDLVSVRLQILTTGNTSRSKPGGNIGKFSYFAKTFDNTFWLDHK